MAIHIGFVSTRFTGADGVTMEAGKWSDILKEAGHECFWWGGEVHRDPSHAMVVSEAHFLHPENQKIQAKAFGREMRSHELTQRIHDYRAVLKEKLVDFLQTFDIQLLIVENALASPMHIPLALALTELIAERKIPTIAHHHEFYWEQSRCAVNCVQDFLYMAFPPVLPTIQHVVISSAAHEALAHRRGVSSIIIPNVLDFEHPPQPNAEKANRLRGMIGLDFEGKLIVQPTRIIRRKGIEHAVEITAALKDMGYQLLITHQAGEGDADYAAWLQAQAQEHGVSLYFLGTHVVDPWVEVKSPENPITLWDIYPHAELITYPSLYEGFGNAFLEAIYFRKPLVVNRYATFVRDIEPLGFDLLIMDGYVSRRLIAKIREVLQFAERREAMVEHNYALAKSHFSYEVLRRRLNFLLMNFFGLGV
ncbi:glycosyltransferase family 4 protein [Desulfosoma caldarium]|uniref:Glycosyltransferase involved in cell wall biosynthesis n=1 Tax=Desulfosoma caldarium TaxID=610254 RepID=A0A3N1UVC2_9BACT|nr:glycosyltransferase family 4 protein [Desulfosoma caldarium]ROQ93608.1 glycosyltransferase involved in cell wall biosynthesis [Desulfosoma caldarium]